MSLLLIVTCVLLIGYCVFMTIINDYKLPESISETSYISDRRLGTTVPFTIMCIICAFGILPLWLTVSSETWKFLAFISCASMVFAGCTPFFKESYEKSVHYVAGIVAFVSGLLWLLATNWIPLAVIWVAGTILGFLNTKKYVFTLELLGYLTVAITILKMAK